VLRQNLGTAERQVFCRPFSFSASPSPSNVSGSQAESLVARLVSKAASVATLHQPVSLAAFYLPARRRAATGRKQAKVMLDSAFWLSRNRLSKQHTSHKPAGAVMTMADGLWPVELPRLICKAQPRLAVDGWGVFIIFPALSMLPIMMFPSREMVDSPTALVRTSLSIADE
jgi:hypothetical protein